HRLEESVFVGVPYQYRGEAIVAADSGVVGLDRSVYEADRDQLRAIAATVRAIAKEDAPVALAWVVVETTADFGDDWLAEGVSERGNVAHCFFPQQVHIERIGHVECEYAFAATSEGPDQDGLPSTRDVDLGDGDFAVHEIAVLIFLIGCVFP